MHGGHERIGLMENVKEHGASMFPQWYCLEALPRAICSAVLAVTATPSHIITDTHSNLSCCIMMTFVRTQS